MTLNQEYNKQLNRINRLMNTARAAGFVFPEGIYLTKPKRVTRKSVEALKNVRTEDILKKAVNRERVIESIAVDFEDFKAKRELLTPVQRKAYLQAEYERERKRLQRFVARKKKEGYTFAENAIPKRPKTITEASVERLRKTTPERLYGKAHWADPLTGKTRTGAYARKIQRQRRIDYVKKGQSKKKKTIFGKDRKVPEEAVITLDGVLEQIAHWEPLSNWTAGLSSAKEQDKGVLTNIINGAIAADGRDAVAQRIRENSVEINTLLQEILYASGSKEGNFKDGRTQINFDIARFSEIITGKVMDVETSKQLTEQMEEMELEE